MLSVNPAGAACGLILLLAVPPAAARAAGEGAYRVGMTTREVKPAGDFDWRGSSARSLKVTIWYPARPDAEEVAIEAPPHALLWQADRAAVDAPPAGAKHGHPLVVLSHGSGGSGMMLAWLGAALARRGFVAAAVNHPGNSFEDVNTVEGFALRWERALDLKAVIDGVLADPALGEIVDGRRIGAAGVSLGGFTVMEIAGGRTDRTEFQRFCAGHPEACRPPPDHAGVKEQVEARERSDARFRAALQHAGDSYRDERVRAVFAMAPAYGHSFVPASLAAISIPVRIVVGDADRAAPAETNARYFAQSIRGARLDVLTGGVGHHVFNDLPTERGKKALPALAVDAPGVDRAAIHERVARMAVEFFGEALR
jgi:predicted dienelactone hydrolase